MQASDIPTKIPTYWAQSAGGAYVRPIPNTSQIGIIPGAASWPDGFVPLNMTNEGAGGIPPFGQDANGVLRQISQWLRWAQAGGGVVAYDSTFSAAVSGYWNGAVVASATTPGIYWLSIADNNTTNPDAGGDNWVTVFDGQPQDVKWRPTSETLPGWLPMNAGTIGSASSGASLLAAAKAVRAYTWSWNNFSNTQCPVTGGRGANAAADFAANKAIGILDMRGITQLGMDTMGGSATTYYSGVPVTSGNAAAAGSIIGEALHAMAAAENATHTHGITDPQHLHGGVAGSAEPIGAGTASAVGGTSGSTALASTGITINNQGSSTPHNTTQRGMVGTFYLKL